MAKSLFSKFDTELKEHLNKISKYAEDKFPNRSWFITITLWQDGDFLAILQSSYGDYADRIAYRKSTNKYVYEKTLIQPSVQDLQELFL